MARKIYLIALILAVVIGLTSIGYLALGRGTPTTSNTGIMTTNGSVVYAYPTSNLSSEISASVGETFGVQLSSNAGSTGYDWNVSMSNGIQYLNYSIVSTNSLVGGPQVRDYWFHVSQSGDQEITLQDKRQFSPYDVVATVKLQVTVSGQGSSTVQSSTAGFQPEVDTLAGGGAQLAMLSYNFQVNSTGGTLFMVFKDYSNSSTVISTVHFDNSPVSNSSIEFTSECSNFKPGSECGVTLIFGVRALQPPSENSAHSLIFTIGSGEQFDFAVTVGTTAEAACTITSSC